MKPSLLFPKAFTENGRSSGLPQLAAAFPSVNQRTVAEVAANINGLTAAGTAPDFLLPVCRSPDSLCNHFRLKINKSGTNSYLECF